MKLNIRTKLIGGFLVVVALLLVVSVISWHGLRSVNGATEDIALNQFPAHQVVRDLVLQAAFQEEHYLGYATTLDPTWLTKARKDTKAINSQFAQLKVDFQDEPELLDLVLKAEKEYLLFNESSERFGALYSEGDPEAGVEEFYVMIAAEGKMGEHVDELALRVTENIEASMLGVQKTNDHTVMVLSITTTLAGNMPKR